MKGKGMPEWARGGKNICTLEYTEKEMMRWKLIPDWQGHADSWAERKKIGMELLMAKERTHS